MADLSEANRKEWDQRAKTYDSQPWQQIMGAQLTAFIHSQLENGFIDPPRADSKQTKLLDYACGTGMVTRAFKSHITSATGMDISQGMVAEYSTRMKHDGIAADAVVGNLLSEDVDSALDDYRGYDVAAVGLGFHHFEDSERCLRRLAGRVKEGGVVLILDWLPSAGGGHGHGHGGGEEGEDEFKHMRHTIAHNGFDEEDG
ncbi:hypothetical protein MBLNU457_g0482t2 [Dothideomycetes sp. NU457]